VRHAQLKRKMKKMRRKGRMFDERMRKTTM